ncbi:hypothetical protein SADUNF_Sadunf04G0075000 [Salix dunnii]|uniref:Uncharacterized protein n=1 Tax=Salix dunnii TaxID=1413687 RepID=A0A835KAZ5_9ROSI|nr:hypothetical protein SADUNF_Sadunf04G0075000 [Salix dunnii]
MGSKNRGGISWRAAISRRVFSFFRDFSITDDKLRSSSNSTPFMPEEAMVAASKHFSSAHKILTLKNLVLSLSPVGGPRLLACIDF